jgi:hypothetical protein
MPWECTEPMSERLRFVTLYREKLFSMTELCARFHISRPGRLQVAGSF